LELLRQNELEELIIHSDGMYGDIDIGLYGTTLKIFKEIGIA
jgi:hypothetical protein